MSISKKGGDTSAKETHTWQTQSQEVIKP